MARRCSTKHYRALAARARSLVPGFNITTDIIVGFPGETDEHWRQGLAFIREVGFSHIHIFPYSPRAGTAAASMPEQVGHEIKRERCRQMHELAQELKRDFLERQTGKVLPVLFENCRHDRDTDTHIYSGYTPNYLRVMMPQETGDHPIHNKIIPVKITGATPAGDTLAGQISADSQPGSQWIF